MREIDPAKLANNEQVLMVNREIVKDMMSIIEKEIKSGAEDQMVIATKLYTAFFSDRMSKESLAGVATVMLFDQVLMNLGMHPSQVIKSLDDA